MAAVALTGWWCRGEWRSEIAVWGAGVLTLAGGAIGVSAAFTLGRNRTVYPEPLPEAHLVQHGIYRHIRHPLYSSVILLAVGWSLWLESVMSMCVCVLLTGFLVLKSRHEERRLIVKFPGYAAYRDRTWRFAPWIW